MPRFAQNPMVPTMYNNVEPADIFNTNGVQIQSEYGEEICVICQEELSNHHSNTNTFNNIYTLPECNHAFHTECIITWFRTGNSNCPCCGNKGINDLSSHGNSGQLRGGRRQSRLPRHGNIN